MQYCESAGPVRRGGKTRVPVPGRSGGGSRRYNVLMAWDGQSEQGDELRGALRKALPHCERLYEVNFGAVLSTYVGPGALGAGVQVLDGLPDEKKKGFPWGNR